MHKTSEKKVVKCYHCGDACREDTVTHDDKSFCCNGCKVVYDLLSTNDLCTYYNLESSPGANAAVPVFKEKYAFLDDQAVVNSLLEFSDGGISKATFYVPNIHCSSCIWLLEKLYRLNESVVSSRVNFTKKEVSLSYKDAEISLRQVVELISSIGYEPQINLSDLEHEKKQASNKKLYIKLGIAGFAFGNSMMFSFPEYLDSWHALTREFKIIFGSLNIFLAIPVLFYSASDYFVSSYKGLKKKILNIDVPISMGILALVARSLFEILSGTGSGYFDSFNGLIFFLLLGRLFQDKTYATLSFERDYKSYFPVSVTIIEEGIQKVVPISNVGIGDTVLLRNQELIPADALLISDSASIDYSFVTGESNPVSKHKNELLYAGGRLNGASVQVRITQKVSQSYLTKLWNNDLFVKDDLTGLSTLSDKVAQNFTIAILTISLLAGMYWMAEGWQQALNIVSAILIIACPCALALSIPFALGNSLRIFGENQFYLKNIKAIERIRSVSYYVFDKTGTLTWQEKPHVAFSATLTEKEKQLVRSLAHSSVHPVSRYIYNYLPQSTLYDVKEFVEISGKGLIAQVDGHNIQLGRASWVGAETASGKDSATTTAHVSIDGTYKGYFTIKTSYRPGLRKVLKSLAAEAKIAIISGDNSQEEAFFKKLFKEEKIEGEILFNQTPFDKQNFIKRMQESGEVTLMIGDGLNDAGALKQSDLGISISENINSFSPACDAILDAKRFALLPRFLQYANRGYNTVLASFVLSFLYNGFGLYFAVTGQLSPLIAAILMPVSSITVVLFATVVTRLNAKMLKL